MKLFLICLLEITTSNCIRGIDALPLPWLQSHRFCEKSGFTAFHSSELASFFILSWIWLPTCSGSILSVQVSVGGWLMRGANQRRVVSLPFLSATRPSSPPCHCLPVGPAPHLESHAPAFWNDSLIGISLLFKMQGKTPSMTWHAQEGKAQRELVQHALGLSGQLLLHVKCEVSVWVKHGAESPFFWCAYSNSGILGFLSLTQDCASVRTFT